MSKVPHHKDCIALDEPQVVDHVSDLSVGDRVLIGDRSQPLTVVDIGTRVVRDSRTDAKTLQTPVAKLRGDWQHATELIIGHQITRWRHGEDTIETVLRERETIVTMASGTPIDPLRTHVTLDETSEQPVACDGGRSQSDGEVDADSGEETDLHVPDDDAIIMTDGGSSVQAAASTASAALPAVPPHPETTLDDERIRYHALTAQSETRRALLIDSDASALDTAVDRVEEVLPA